MPTKTITRRMSLEDDFMDHNTDDLLYSFMRCLSTSKENEGEVDAREKRFEYLTLKELGRYKKTLGAILGCSSRTVNNKIVKLKERGLIQETSIPLQTANGRTLIYPCYTFPYDYDGNYKIVDKEMLMFLINTRNNNVIRVYLYLLSKFEWKPDYVFTLEEIKVALGFSPTYYEASKLIEDILKSLLREGIISYEQKWMPIETVDNTQVMTQRMILKNVLKRPPQ